MIESLVTGKLNGTAKTQTGKNGKPFTTCKVRTPMTNGEAVFVNVITFDESVGAGLLALGDGDGVAPALTPAGTPAPAGAPAAKSVYSPNQGVTQGSAPASAHAPVTLWRPGQAVDDASMDQIKQAYVTANSKLKQVRSDWELANSLQNRAAVSPEVRERIKAVLDAVRAETDQVNSQYFGAKREWMRVRGEQAYSPSRSLQQTASESINRDFGARYSN